MNDKKSIQNVIMIFVLIAIIMFFTHYIQFIIVDGTSMDPSFHDKQILTMKRQYYKNHELNRYDVIVFKTDKNMLLIKRVIALPGETIYINENGQIFINDQELKEPIAFETIQDAGIANKKITLGNDECFVLGDNRNNSVDSRDASIGCLKITEIEGKVK